MSITDYEFDPLTGIKTKLDYHDDGKVTITRTEDVAPALEFARYLRNENEGVHKDRWNHYAVIPVSLQLKMHKEGVNPWGDPKEVTKYINKYAPQYKVTNLWHDSVKAGKKDVKIQIKPND